MSESCCFLCGEPFDREPVLVEGIGKQEPQWVHPECHMASRFTAVDLIHARELAKLARTQTRAAAAKKENSEQARAGEVKEKSQVNMLDQLLCEKLGIYKVFPDAEQKQEPVYPSLSTTGEGMLLLMQTLRKKGHKYTISGHDLVIVRASTRGIQRSGSMTAFADCEPMALALATADALDIDVSEDCLRDLAKEFICPKNKS